MVGRRRTLNDPISQLRSQLAAEKKLENDKRTDDYERDGSNRPHNSRRTVSTLSFEQNYLRGRVERRLKMQKGWADQSPAVLLRKYLATDQPPRAMQRQTAAIRSMRLPIVLLQMHLRDQVKADPENNPDIADLLPSEDQWQSLMSVLNHNGHTQEDLDQYINILFSSGDEQRCERFLADDSAKPMFLLSYLLRRGSSFSQISTLDGMIRYFKKRLCDTTDKAVPLRAELGCMGRARTAMQILAPEDFTQIVDMLAFHCRRIEPRRLMQLAEVVADFILRYEAKSKHPKETYHAQCKFFNTTLNAIASRMGFGPQRKSAPYVFMWEAQRTLLGMSGGLPEALLVDKNGFKAIRAVLAGLPKNRDEVHSARRHSQSWPPYLQPGDGMDEVMEPDESWTRVVRAGMMMQEAGFPKGEVDVALDTLQGLAQDGTPTIQQRKPISLDRNLTAWAASIMATRNASEAWERFKHPPEPGMKAGPAEFGAMFQRLFAREIDADDESLPGDTSLNYPTQKVLNLTELEKSRLQPPTPAELYEMMRRDKIRPDEQCLIILLSNADSLIKAHRYLVNGSTYRHSYLSLTSSNPTQDSLKSIPLPVFSAYIDVCSRVSSRRGRSLLRAIHLIELRLTRKHQNWASYIWEPILKNLGQHHHGLGISLTAQLRLLLDLVDRIDATHGMTLALFNRFTLSLRKILRREVEKLSAAVESNSADLNVLTVLYGIGAEQAEVAPKLTDQDLMALSLIRSAGSRMKALFYGFVIEERERARVGELNEVSWLDNMRARRDPVMAPNAHELMLALAFAGEFEEMASVIKWLMREWSPRELQEELENLEGLPRDLDMLETLCVFRAFAEPMITTQQLDTVLNDFNRLEIHWEWPDDTTVKGYLEGRHHSNSNRELSEVLGWIRRRRPTRQAEQDGQGPEIADPQPDWTKIKREALGPQEVSQEDIRKRVYGIN
ncbi:prefoldin subunit 3 [Fusarium albosuccineum]|uniref:Prefoldin subunit 3 n=1 Tax=Fusarium albosuccineum TaxID=1237068 RepID=A0A8H4L1B1_9HYPO|nr:prefoldin subunit 3 [Fusarium albosuccineum]